MAILAICFMNLSCLAYSSTLKMEVFKTTVTATLQHSKEHASPTWSALGGVDFGIHLKFYYYVFTANSRY
jgi:hypothetical protein